MERFAVFGLGTFGWHVAHTLYAAGRDVIGIDTNGERVQAAAEFMTQAINADVTDRPTLEAIGVDKVDACIVSLGEKMDTSTLAALHAVEMGLGYVAVKAVSEDHGRILRALGVHEVIFPEKDRAIRLANRLARTDVVDVLPLMPGYSVTEMRAPAAFVGKTLRDLALRNKLRVQLVAIQSGAGSDKQVNIVPRADDVIREGDLLVLLGDDGDMNKVRDIFRL